ncbi:MAG TPA: peptidoglycan-binding protein [Acidimicrobiia bacterium]|nr:peptidoglycan-binding protein [Acidimicrobiia bacterium]
MLLRRGDRGNAVRDLSARLVSAGACEAAGDVFDEGLERAVRAFQEARGLRVDGICGPETWGALVESGFSLGDRLLYLAHPMLRGDDVAELQHRLNVLGFDAGREDGILGRETDTALRQFQRNTGTSADGVCGPSTLEAIKRVSSLAAGSVASVRERESLRSPRHLDELRVFIAAEPAMAVLATSVTKALRFVGANAVADSSGSDPGILTAEANRFEADVFLALTNSGDPGARCAYFASGTFRSEGGLCLAIGLTESLRTVLTKVDDPVGRTYRFLRETRMPAVVCELVGSDDRETRAMLTSKVPEISRAVVEGLRRGVEEPHGDEL